MDSVLRRGRPRIPVPPRLTCLRRTSGMGEVIVDNTIWHRNADSSRGLKAEVTEKPKKISRFSGALQSILSESGKSTKKNVWLDINGLILTEDDEKMIVKPDEWISDNIVNASQRLLQKHFPKVKGLQNVLLSEISCLEKPIDWMQFQEIRNKIDKLTEKRRDALNNISKASKDLDSAQTLQELEESEKLLEVSNRTKEKCDKQLTELKKFCIKTNGFQPLERGAKFVQILLDKTQNRSHWVCVSNLKTEDFNTVRIYDSHLRQIKFSIKNYSNFLKISLKRLYFESDVNIELPLVTQSDNYSGGVYAIAFAQALCEGKDPSDILFSCSARQMRVHLFKCLTTYHLQGFPTGNVDIFESHSVNRSLHQKKKHKSKPKEKKT